MPRSNVPSAAGWHHVMNRCTSEIDWIGCRAVAEVFLRLIGEACGALPVELHAYCLLPKHYHLLARAQPSPLRQAVATLESCSRFPGTDAPRIVPVAFGRHLTSVSRYIHLNPVDAGLVRYPEEWRYSSFRAYLGDRDAPLRIVTDAVLGRFGNIGARHRHRAYVYAGMNPGTRDRDGRPRASVSPERDWRIDPILVLRPVGPPAFPERAELPRLVKEVGRSFELPAATLRAVRFGGPDAATARGALVHAASRLHDHRLREIAAFLGYASPAAAAAAAERFVAAARTDSGLRSRMAEALARATIAS